jgi:hypothetical protein
MTASAMAVSVITARSATGDRWRRRLDAAAGGSRVTGFTPGFTPDLHLIYI